ncbi:MAG TPA: sigma-70 family RNA polymerase sigma factor [Opitutaceae bacterium]|nr:sigma-70 family RNA polymerase sigma factor [Opitutaceae bacterium]
MADDNELLRRYVRDRSDVAFAELVQRHLNLVYSVALRQVGGDAHLARDVVQTVFTALARKAATLVDRPVLGGWLYRSAQFAAIDVVRSERRRRAREELAHAMNEPADNVSEETDWEKLRPALDEAIGELNDADRDAVVLRFFEAKPFGEIGVRLQVTENAARMRVERALEKLHGLLARRGVTSTTAALGIALGSQVGMAAPAGLASAVSGAAIAGTAGSAALWGAFLTMSKIKVGILAAIIGAIAVTGVVEVRANRALSAELNRLRTESVPPARLQKEKQELTSTLGTLSSHRPEAEELARLKTRIAQIKARPAGVSDAGMKPVSEWKNSGWATPEAALETVMWAAATENTEELVANAGFIGEAKAPAEAAFAKLPEVVRLKYGDPSRLLGMVCFGSRGATDDAKARAAYGGTVVAFQVIDTAPAFRGGVGTSVRWWERLATGEEREKKQPFPRDGDRFSLGASTFSPSMWEWVVSQVDPATGELLPRKLPAAPKTKP